MCYGDIHHGSDGYYEQWALEQEAKQLEETTLENGYYQIDEQGFKFIK